MDPKPLSCDVLIAGAGIGGLTAALALARNGASVTVLERSEVLGEVGAGLQLSPNAMHVLTALNLGADVAMLGFEPEYSTIRHHVTGRRYLTYPLKDTCRARYGAPYIHIHRSDLHRTLVRAVKEANVRIALNCTVTGVQQNSGEVIVETSHGSLTTELLIGADGLRSKVRPSIGLDVLPRFTGQLAWRATIPRRAAPPGIVAPAATVWSGPGKHLVTYYLRGGDLINIVAVEERDDWTKDSWTEPGDPKELRAAFNGWHGDVTRLLEAVDECHLWALYSLEPLPRWSKGRVALLGDAAHPMLPFLAQGAAMAIEDAWALAAMLIKDPAEEALNRYSDVRRPRATMVQSMAAANARLFHRSRTPGDLWHRSKLNLARFVPQAADRQFDRIYSVDVTQAFR